LDEVRVVGQDFGDPLTSLEGHWDESRQAVLRARTPLVNLEASQE
jgi:hypothetical protein